MACAAGISILVGKLVLGGGTSRAMDSMGSSSIVAGGREDGTRIRVIRESIEALGDVGANMVRVEPSV